MLWKISEITSAHRRSTLCTIASSLNTMTYEAILVRQFRLFIRFVSYS